MNKRRNRPSSGKQAMSANLRAFNQMLEARREKGLYNSSVWANITTGEEMFHWWMEDDVLPGQLSMDDLMEDNNV